MALSRDEKLQLVTEVSSQLTNMVMTGYTGKLVIHFREGEIMNEDEHQSRKLYDLIRKRPMK